MLKSAVLAGEGEEQAYARAMLGDDGSDGQRTLTRAPVDGYPVDRWRSASNFDYFSSPSGGNSAPAAARSRTPAEEQQFETRRRAT